MTLISSDIGAPQRHGPRIAQAIRAWFAAVRDRRRDHREKQALARLPDHLLRDMGLEQFIARRAPNDITFWR